jgi:hypothetical protein
MKIGKEQKRLRAIKLRYVLFPKKCKCCGEEYALEKMWSVNRYGINAVCNTWYYCQNCMHSAEDVLNEVDTDENPNGIYNVDSFFAFGKKDYTRIEAFMGRPEGGH